MASLAALVRDNTNLDRDQLSHLNRLTSEWHTLADFCFADLLLYVPTKDDRWLIVGQVRPSTGQTVYHTDWVGSFANATEQSVLASSFKSGEIPAELAEELADVLFVLICIANQTGVDLQHAFEQTMQKKETRDALRHRMNEKLGR